MENRGDVYATHGLGPVAQALNIHRGDRMTTLVAMDTKSVHGKALVEKRQASLVKNSAMVIIPQLLFVQPKEKSSRSSTM